MSEQISEPGNAFSRLLAEHNGGHSMAELSEALQNIVAAVRDTNKPGKLVYTVVFTPSGNAIVVNDKVEVKAPLSERDASIFFATDSNTLQRDNPAQKTLNLREIEKPVIEIRNLASA